ncbi:MAG: TonB-dependent receptor [Pseudomonadota bacterium]|nr:TonB-dependent receptor [Pseudomonadota bacterium]
MKLARLALPAALATVLHTPVSAQDELDFLLQADEPPAQASPPPPTERGGDAQPVPEPAQESAQEPPVYDTVIPVPEPASPEPPREVARKPERGRQLEEIIVTAQKRESTLQDTPISMEAFGAEKLELRGIGGLEDLGSNVPSMVIEPFPLSNTTLRISIRGIGVTDSQVTQDPAVGIYIDGVYLARSVGLALDLADIERMEVLRGPQGVLYGRNSTGGAINIITRRPDPSAFSMNHKLTIGERNLWVGKSAFNLPLNDELAIKLALLARRSDGFVENTGEGRDFGDRSALGGRFDVRWLPSDTLSVDYGYDFTDLEYVNYMFQAILRPETNHGLAEAFKPYAESNTVYSHRRLHSLASGAPMEASDAEVSGHTLTLTQQLGSAELKYIGAYRRLEDSQYPDLSGGKGDTGYRVDTNAYDSAAARMINNGVPTPLVIPTTFQDQWSHELQISGSAWDDRINYIAGLYYFTEEGGEDGGPVHHIQSATIDPQQSDPLLSLLPPFVRAQLQNNALPRLSAYWDYLFGIENKAYAAYGQFSLRPDWFDSRLNLTVGLRASRDERYAIKDFIQSQFVEVRLADASLFAVPIPGSVAGTSDDFVGVEASSTYDDFSPSANLQFDITDMATTYLSYATAYKSGGFNTRDPQVSGESGRASDGTDYGFGFVEGFKPEQVRSWELGLKSEWLQRALRLNGAVFYSDYTDMQTNFLIAGTISDTKSRNAGKARITGFELEGAFVPAVNLVLGFQYAYLDAEVLEVIDVDGNNVAHLYPFIAAPPHSGVLFADWTVADFDWGNLRAYASWNYVGDRTGFVITEERRGLTEIDGYGLLNARVMLNGLRMGNRGTLDLALWGKNLLDEEYELTAIDNLPQADRAVIWGEPRAIGFDLIYRYE